MTDTLKLKGMITSHGFTQKDIAKILQISSTTFNYKLNNKVDFKASEIKKLCNVLNLTIKDVEDIFLISL